jgi:hypothetical protein
MSSYSPRENISEIFTGSHSRGRSRESIIVLFPVISCQRNVNNWIPDYTLGDDKTSEFALRGL